LSYAPLPDGGEPLAGPVVSVATTAAQRMNALGCEQVLIVL